MSCTGMKGIRHVVVVMFENRSFFHLLGSAPGVDNGGKKQEEHFNVSLTTGERIYAQPVKTETMCGSASFPNDSDSTLRSLKDNASGFVQEFELSQRNLFEKDPLHYEPLVSSPDERGAWPGEPLTYWPWGSLPATHGLASAGVICDRWFSSVAGPTWPNRLVALSGTCHDLDSMPGAPGDFALAHLLQQSQPSIFQLLENAGRSYRIFYHDAPLTLLFSQCWNEKVRDMHRPFNDFFKACEGSESEFPEFCWLEPQYSADGSDFHPPHNPLNGDRLLGQIYNALASNPKLMESTLLVVTFDEHGGFYDPIMPPNVPLPQGTKPSKEGNLKTLGVRVPTILFSPKLNRGIDSTVYDHCSLLAFLCDLWSIPRSKLGPRVVAARHFGHLFLRQRQIQQNQNPSLSFCLLPSKLPLVPHDPTPRSGSATLDPRSGGWNSFQVEVRSALEGLLRILFRDRHNLTENEARSFAGWIRSAIDLVT